LDARARGKDPPERAWREVNLSQTKEGSRENQEGV